MSSPMAMLNYLLTTYSDKKKEMMCFDLEYHRLFQLSPRCLMLHVGIFGFRYHKPTVAENGPG